MCQKWLGHDVKHRQPRVQRGKWILKDQLNVPSHFSQFASIEFSNVHGCAAVPMKENTALSSIEDTQDELSYCCFPAAALTHEAEGFPFVDCK